jgi:hypothetical protein
LERIEEDKFISSFDLNPDKLISDPIATEKLFELINLTSSESKLKLLLHILKCLAKADAVSLLEVLQKVSPTSNVLYDDTEKRYDKKDFIIRELLSFSCVEEYLSLRLERRFFTSTDIGKALRETSKNLT